jgi:hypothetical protein
VGTLFHMNAHEFCAIVLAASALSSALLCTIMFTNCSTGAELRSRLAPHTSATLCELPGPR